MTNIDDAWPRIEPHASAEFKTRTGLVFTYRVPGRSLRVTRGGREINRSLSRTTFAKALEKMPTERPSDLKDRQGSAYTWGILVDPRIRLSDWRAKSGKCGSRLRLGAALRTMAGMSQGRSP